MVFQCVDVGTDLESWSQFDVHACHQVVLSQQQQSLAVDLLHPESFCHITAACSEKQHRDTVRNEARVHACTPTA